MSCEHNRIGGVMASLLALSAVDRGFEPGKWTVMYLCVGGIDFASFYDFDI